MFIFITFCAITLIQLLYYTFFYVKFSDKTSLSENKALLPISIIVCAKNEADNLAKNLPLLAKQNYPKFEIVLVDDFSTDNSREIMQQFQQDFSTKNCSILITSPEKNIRKGKKNALTTGIKLANYEHLLLTDADCKPNSEFWISSMAEKFSSEKTMVLGYGAYQKIENSTLNKIIRFETLLTAIQYFSYANLGKAYMAVGRNIAYKKEEFQKVNGFKNHENILSGDDDLLLNQMANKKNVATCLSPNSFTISKPETSFKNWIKQKRRHITTANHYKACHKISLALFYISQITFWILAVLSLLVSNYLAATIFLIVSRYILWYAAISKSARRLEEKDLIRYAPIYEFSIIFIQLYIFMRNLISPPKHW
jgi:cellulose synthase/poly-beta-1,6-N-acetylglucosamine synthase-like glycosyltransferase